MYLSYNIGALRCFPAFLLYASFIRNQNGAADTARGPSGCLHPDGPGSTANGVEELASAQTAGTAQTSHAAQPIGGTISKGYQARCRKCRKPPETFSHR